MNNLLINNLTLDQARQMLIYECKLRKSEKIQNLYTLIQTGKIQDLELIENYVQYATIKFFDYEPSEKSLKNYRMINSKFGSQVTDYAFYLKYNIMKDHLYPGSIVDTRDIKLIKYSDKTITDFKNISNGNLSVIFSGSIT